MSGVPISLQDWISARVIRAGMFRWPGRNGENGDAAGCVEAMPAALRDHGQHAAFQDESVFPALAPEDREFRLSGQHLHQLIAALMPLPRAGAIETAGENGAISEFSKICKG